MGGNKDPVSNPASQRPADQSAHASLRELTRAFSVLVYTCSCDTVNCVRRGGVLGGFIRRHGGVYIRGGLIGKMKKALQSKL